MVGYMIPTPPVFYAYVVSSIPAAHIDAAAAPMGPGENGRPVIVDKLHLNESKKLFQINQFNLYISDMISLNRTVPDMRPVG